jgi:hypothetical protein
VHFGIGAGGWNAGERPKDKLDVALFLAEALTLAAIFRRFSSGP